MVTCSVLLKRTVPQDDVWFIKVSLGEWVEDGLPIP